MMTLLKGDQLSEGYPYDTAFLHRLHPDGWKDIPVVPVRVSDLIPTQEAVTFERIMHLLRGGTPETGDPYPHVVLHEGRLYVHDGHHRYLIALIRGELYLLVRLVSDVS